MFRGSHGAIVVGVDGSQDSTTALAWALRHAQIAGLVVVVMHAWLPDEPGEEGDDATFPAGGGQDHNTIQRVMRDRAMTEQAARDRVHQTVGAASARVPIGRSLLTQVVAQGEPGAILVELSTDAAQLVVGATGSGALPGIYTPALGSTSRFVLRHAWCPVTVVPSARLRAEQPSPQPPAYGVVPQARTPGVGS